MRPLLMALGLTQVIGWGTTYYLLGRLAEPIGATLGMSRWLVLAGVSLSLLVGALVGPISGRYQDRHGSRLIVTGGSIALAGGLGAIGLAEGPWTYFLGWTLVGIGTPTALYQGAFTALTQFDAPNGRRAITVLTFIGGLASTIFWPLTAWLQGFLDWRSITLLYAGLNLCVCLPIHVWVLRGEAGGSSAAPATPTQQPALPSQALPLAFLLLAAVLSFVALIFNAWAMLVFPVLAQLGYAPAMAVMIASMVGAFQFVGRFGEMIFGNAVSPLMTGLVSVSMFPLALVFLLFSNAEPLFGFAFAAALGIGNGLITIMRGTVTLLLFGSHGYGEKLGKVQLAQGICGGLAPILGGLFLDEAGARALVALFTLCAFSALFLMLGLISHCRRHGVGITRA